VLEARLPELRPEYELTTSAFFDIGVPEELARANEYFADKLSDEA
jgi:hypothetical protein